MARPLSTLAFSSLLAVGYLLAPTWCAAQEALDSSTISAREDARRRAAARDALMQIQEARTAYAAKRYTQAVEHYRNALSVLPEGKETEKQRTFIKESLSDALIARAMDYRSVGRTQEAIDFLQEAIQLAPGNKRAKIELSYTEDPVRHNPALAPTDVRDVEEVSRLLTLGYGYLDLGKYDDALQTFQTVAKYDRYNEAAKRGIEAANKRIAEYLRASRDRTRAGMLSEVDREWDIHSDTESTPGTALANTITLQTDENEEAAERSHTELLDTIRVPHFSLDNATIEDAIQILSGIVRSYEAATPNRPRTRSLNFTLDIGTPDSAEYKQIINRRVSYNLNDVSLKQVVSNVARAFGLDFFIEPSGVEFSGHGGRIITRTFNGVEPAIFMERMIETQTGDDDDDDEGGRRISVNRLKIADFFKDIGVDTVPGSGYNYSPRTRQLVVRNTRENINLISKALNDVQATNWNIVLNVIVVEVDEDDLADLGFDWVFQVGWSNEINMSGGLEAAYSSITGMPILNTTYPVRNTVSPVVTGSLRSINEVEGSRNLESLIQRGAVRDFANQQATHSPYAFGLRGIWTAADVSVFMRGLSQKTGADTIASPSFVFEPHLEESVTFTNVREMFAPSSYDPPDGGVRVIQENRNPTYPNGGGNGRRDDDYGYDSAPITNYTKGVLGGIAAWAESWVPSTSLLPTEGTIEALAASAGAAAAPNNWDRDNNDWENDGRARGVIAWARGAQPLDFIHYGKSEGTEESFDGIGTILQVHKAEPTPDGNSVRLAFTTVINEFEGFLDWGSPINVTMRSQKESQTVQLSENNIVQPIFKRYITNTNVNVADGGVLVLGGLREARIVRYQDKVPILGDLPLVGRFFRSEGEHKRRRALLFFAKVNIVDPTGRKINGSDAGATVTPGLP